MELIKHRIAHYWAHRAEAFQTQRIREFEDEKHARWLAEFNRYIPHDRTLRVLDLGTGTGFFAFVFAAEGHDATGIDLTPDMIEKAKETVGILGVDAQFEVMDAEQPAFPPESFDVLVTRNLTWTLPHLPMAYREWYKLLKPGGVLINFDADYCRSVEDGDDGDLPDNHAHKNIDPGRASRWTWAYTNASMPRSTSSTTRFRSSPSQRTKNKRQWIICKKAAAL